MKLPLSSLLLPLLFLAVTISTAAASAASDGAPFELPPLPFANTDLEPYISSATLKFHHGKHHAKYVATLNSLLMEDPKNSDLKGLSLEEIIVAADRRNDQGLFNNAAQSWNHAFYWNCMKRNGGGTLRGLTLWYKIEANFGSFHDFLAEFKKAGNTAFGSGWAWLVYHKSNNSLSVMKTIGAGTPLTNPDTVPLLCMDVWEHAYYLDYQNMRTDYVDMFMEKLVNWDFVTENLKAALKASGRGEEL